MVALHVLLQLEGAGTDGMNGHILRAQGGGREHQAADVGEYAGERRIHGAQVDLHGVFVDHLRGDDVAQLAREVDMSGVRIGIVIHVRLHRLGV